MPAPNAVFGTASLSPVDDVIVGTFGSWTIDYRVGELGVDDGSTILVAFSQTSDMGTPQFDDPQADNYCTVTTDGPATVTGTYDPAGYVRPFKHAFEIAVVDGSLGPGDTVTLTLGDRSEGSRGLQAQSFVETDFRFRVLVDAHNTGDYEEAEGTLTFDLVAGGRVGDGLGQGRGLLGKRREGLFGGGHGRPPGWLIAEGRDRGRDRRCPPRNRYSRDPPDDGQRAGRAPHRDVEPDRVP